MEAVRTSETSVYSNETTRRCIPESCHLHTRRRENLKSRKTVAYFVNLIPKEIENKRECSFYPYFS
jgi:hypothetical protein